MTAPTLLLTLTCVLLAGCPIDVAYTGSVSDSHVEPRTRIAVGSPAEFSFRVELEPGSSPVSLRGFQLTSDDLGLGAKDGPTAPVRVIVRRLLDGGRAEPVELRRGRCARGGCTGSFLLRFELVEGPPLTFDWSLRAFINFETVEDPTDARAELVVDPIPPGSSGAPSSTPGP